MAYHFPAVRLLADGWNPLEVRTPEAFRDAFGFVQGDMEIVHVLFQMKGVWLFNAVAQNFTREFFSPMLPLTLVLFPAVAIRVCRTVQGVVGRMLAVVVLYFLIPRSFFSLDAALTLSAIGLMASMYAVVRGCRPDVPVLAGYTAWLAASKLNGIGHAVVIWAVFGCIVFAKHLPVKRLLAAIGLAALVFLPLGITPFVTGAVDYGHPLFPHCSRNPAHPQIDICADFEWKRNDDMKSMGHLASLANAYVSPSLVRWIVRNATGRDDFLPRNQMFEHYPGLSGDGGVTAVHWSVRILFWISVAFLCCGGKMARTDDCADVNHWTRCCADADDRVCQVCSVGACPVHLLGCRRFAHATADAEACIFGGVLRACSCAPLVSSASAVRHRLGCLCRRAGTRISGRAAFLASAGLVSAAVAALAGESGTDASAIPVPSRSQGLGSVV